MFSDIGTYIKKKRMEQKLTLKDVSSKSGLSVSFLSQFERSQTTISVDALTTLADVLGLDMRELMDHSLAAPQTRPVYVLHSFDRPASRSISSNQITTSLASGEDDLRLLPRLYTLLPRQIQEQPIPFSHKGEEFIYVLEGILTLIIEGIPYHLYPEDTAHFPSSKEHIWCNDTNRNVKFILVNLTDQETEHLS